MSMLLISVGGECISNDVSGWLSIYLSLFVMWIFSVIYSVIFNKLTLKQALSTENDDYFLLEFSNIFFYCITVIALIVAIALGIYAIVHLLL